MYHLLVRTEAHARRIIRPPSKTKPKDKPAAADGSFLLLNSPRRTTAAHWVVVYTGIGAFMHACMHAWLGEKGRQPPTIRYATSAGGICTIQHDITDDAAADEF